MKKTLVLLSLLLVLSVIGCSKEVAIKETVKGNIYTYYEMSDGTWKYDDYSYKYRLKISGRIPNATKNTTFTYLSNIEKISFEQAWKAGGLSSNSDDYFDLEDAVLVELN